MATRVERAEALGAWFEGKLSSDNSVFATSYLVYSAPTWRNQIAHLREWGGQLDEGTRSDGDRWEASFAGVSSGISGELGGGWSDLAHNIDTTEADIAADAKKAVEVTTIGVGTIAVIALVVFLLAHAPRR
jgi:hypothetical protein